EGSSLRRLRVVEQDAKRGGDRDRDEEEHDRRGGEPREARLPCSELLVHRRPREAERGGREKPEREPEVGERGGVEPRDTGADADDGPREGQRRRYPPGLPHERQ